jgi:hypothetical protein
MKVARFALVLTVFVLAELSVRAATRYVSATSSSPAPPFVTWATAATNIQDAIDASSAGDFVSVTNGAYQTGGRTVYGSLTNRIAITKAVTVQSANGPAVTFIYGSRVPGTTNGDAAVRCAYLTNGAVLSGFTLTNGATRGFATPNNENSGGGAWCESGSVISNCVIAGNSAYSVCGGVYGGILTNSTISGNKAPTAAGVGSATLRNCSVNNNSASSFGGGASGCTLIGCDIRGNNVYPSGGGGGGAANSTLINCTVAANAAGDTGGGAYYCTASNCTLSGNSSVNYGGGGYQTTLINCILLSNSSAHGGASANGALTNCVMSGNSANLNGGGTYFGTLDNCTVSDNISLDGGGTFSSFSRSTVVYYNRTFGATAVSSNWSAGTFSYSCTSPLPSGDGNFTNAPLFVAPPSNDMRLQNTSPCINSGCLTCGVAGLDILGSPRVSGGTVDIGAYEFQSPVSGISYYWLQKNSFPIDGSVDFVDTDGDGMNNWQEWRCSTDPRDASSALRVIAVARGTPGVTLTWQSVTNRKYFVQRRTNFVSQPSFAPLATNVTGQAGSTTFQDSGATGPGSYFYRVGVP